MTRLQSAVRDEHPRIFFDPETFASLEDRIEARDPALYESVRSDVDALRGRTIDVDDWGETAARAAFCYGVTGDAADRDLARDLLERSVEYYRQCYETDTRVAWTVWSRLQALAAYDWLAADLSAETRRDLGAELLDAVAAIQTPDRWEARSSPHSGFYGPACLLWYAGLATSGDGIDDERAAQFLEEGHYLHLAMLEHRSALAGDDGSPITYTLHYALQRYPYATFNFFHSLRSATGREIAGDWPYLAKLPLYVFWNWLPDCRMFGLGDDFHRTNRLPVAYLDMHLAQIVHFYGEHAPRAVAFAKWQRERLPDDVDPDAVPFALTRYLHDDHPDIDPAGPPSDCPIGRHFANVGQTFFRSGNGPEDTYAQFTAGGETTVHRHYDCNHFTIYRDGFLALDTGTRPQPSGAGTASDHLTAYYPRTVAHNTVLVRMPDEEFPDYWGEAPAGGVPNDGGQRSPNGSSVVAFESRPRYSYVAGDATEAYHSAKCDLALRQFVFVPPAHFVVFDRVRTTDASYPTTWLLHTADEPDIDGDQFTAAHEGGRLVGQSILPAEATIEKRGGAGEQFWSDGRNWPLPDGHEYPEDHPLFGQWRIETRPITQTAETRFLYLLRTADREDDGGLDGEVVRTVARRGVRFGAGDTEWEVAFDVDGPAGGHVRRFDGGQLRNETELARSVDTGDGLLDSVGR